MAISHVGSNQNSNTGTTNLAVTLPVGVAEGDLCDAAYCQGTGLDVAQAFITSGYTEQFQLYSNDENADNNLCTGYKIQGATPDSDVTFKDATSSGMVGVVTVLRGADATTPVDVAPTSASAINSGTPDPPSITPVTAGAWITITAGSSEADAVSNAPTNYDLRADIQGTQINIMIATRELASPALEDPGTFADISGTTADSWNAVTKAWRPAADDGAFSLALASVAWTYTATAVSLERGREIVPNGVSWAWNATNVTFNKGKTLALDSVAWTWTAESVSLERGREIVPNSVAWSYTVTDVALERGLEIVPAAVSWQWTADNVSFEHGYEIVPENVSWSWSAGDVTFTLAAEKTLAVDSVAWSWSAGDVSLEHGFEIVPDSTAWSWSVDDVTLTIAAQATAGLRRRKLAAERLARRKIKESLAQIERVAARPVITTKAVEKAETHYEQIKVQALSLPDLSGMRFEIEQAQRFLDAIKALHRKRLRAEEEWLLLT
jgi:hypothetical protein